MMYRADLLYVTHRVAVFLASKTLFQQALFEDRELAPESDKGRWMEMTFGIPAGVVQFRELFIEGLCIV
jgi:hypothetical protein